MDFEQVQVLRDPELGITACVVLHDTRLGPAHGGIRRWRYPSLSAALLDAHRLAAAMTWKCALAGVAAGGGKAVILDQPGMDRAAAYRLVGACVQQMGGRFFTGPDVGTTGADLEVVGELTRFVALPGDGGPGDLGEATATGVFAAMQALVERMDCRSLDRAHVAVQGLGSVGMRLCRRLSEAGAALTVADVDAGRAAAARRQFGCREVQPAEILATDCDVLAPCALGEVLGPESAPMLRARGVCGAANNVLADAATGVALHHRGVLVVPDFVANAGALIQGATFHLEGRPPDPGRIERIGTVAGEILDRARRQGTPPGEVALALARERVAAAQPRPYLPQRP